MYLATHENSNNLNDNLFFGCAQGDNVIVLEIDATQLNTECYFPDDAFFYMLDGEFCEYAIDLSAKELKEFLSENTSDFCKKFGLNAKKGHDLLKAFCKSDGTMEEYAPIAKKMGIEYLQEQGETAYLGNVSPTAIKGWHYHPDSPGPWLTAENTLPNIPQYKANATARVQNTSKNRP